MQILMAIMMATFMFVMIPRAEVCAERIEEVLGTETSVHVAAQPVTELPLHGHLELRGVDFHYPGAEAAVLSGVSLTARPGEVTAVIGSTGAGKTTLLNLVPRLFDATGGDVLVDGVNRSRISSAERSRRTCATATRTPPTRSCGTRSASPRPGTLSSAWRAASTRRSPRAARTCPAGSGNGSSRSG
jgi:ABC-type multidrug transport system fused ATPase/permease subunit